MSEFKGTKGKWKIEYLATEEDIRAVINKSQIDVWAIDVTVEEANANALLISKAPEMLEMLEELSKHHGLFPDDRLKIKKLIKEATDVQ